MHSDWDVESYKTDFESEEHWELKKNFMLAHKDRIPEDELVCLAQVFTNIEFLGCRYPDETMRKVAELAKGVVESYREKKKNSLKRTFVAASDAAAAKVKGLSEPSPKKQAIQAKSKKKRKKKKGKKSKSANIKKASNQNGANMMSANSSSSKCISQNQEPKPMNETNEGAHLQTAVSGLDISTKNDTKQSSGSLKDFVLFHFVDHFDDPITSLLRNGKINKLRVRWELTKLVECKRLCRVYLGDELLEKGIGTNKKTSRKTAAINALQKLQSMCYTIKLKALYVSENRVTPTALGQKVEEHQVKCAIGEKIMKMMGWTGGALGVQQQGIIEPVSLFSNWGRRGLGHDDVNTDAYFMKRAKDCIEKWLRRKTDEDLVFSSSFTNFGEIQDVSLSYHLLVSLDYHGKTGPLIMPAADKKLAKR